MGWVLALVALVGLIWAFRAYQRRLAAQSFAEVARLVSEGGGIGPLQPDLGYAAEAYARIAAIRRNSLPGDLHHLAKANAWHSKRNGATELQALSAYWGGIYAIEDDLTAFEDGLAAYEDAKAELGREPTRDPKSKFYASASIHLSRVLATFPKEFASFATAYRPEVASL